MNESQTLEQLKKMRKNQKEKDKEKQIEEFKYPFTLYEMIDYLSQLPERQAWEYWENFDKFRGNDDSSESLEFLENRHNLPKLINLFARIMAKDGITWSNEILNRVFGESYPQAYLHQALNQQEIKFLQKYPHWLLFRPYPQFPPIMRADLINRMIILHQRGQLKNQEKQFFTFMKQCQNDLEIKKWIDKIR